MTLTVPAPPVEESYFPFLLQRIAEGNRDAEHELSLHFSRGIRYLLARQLGPVRADELADGVLAAVMTAIRSGEICEPQCLPGLARSEVRRAVAAEAARPQLKSVSDHDQSTACGILRSLPPSHREALVRYYQEGQTAERICRDLGLTPERFRAIRDRAKKDFKNI